MNDTEITVIGTVVSAPERRRIEKINAVITSFRLISNSRKFDKDTEQWVDRASFRVKVNCWRRLGDHVYDSVFSGDPVIVKGRITTEEWTTEHEERRINYEIEAIAVGHDLARGRSKFAKAQRAVPGTVVEDDDRINGEPAQRVSEGETPTVEPGTEAGMDDFALAEYAAGTAVEEAGTAVEGAGTAVEDAGSATADAESILREAGLEPESAQEDEPGEEGPDLVGATGSGSFGRGRRRGR